MNKEPELRPNFTSVIGQVTQQHDTWHKRICRVRNKYIYFYYLTIRGSFLPSYLCYGQLDITAMHFKPHLLFAVLAALTSPTIAGPPSIKFCDHKGSDACITEKIEMAVCQTLPDSNNKGDGGSTFEVHCI